MIIRIKPIKQGVCFLIFSLCALLADASHPIFLIEQDAGSTLPSTVGLYDTPLEFSFRVTNQSRHAMRGMQYDIPDFLVSNTGTSTCGNVLDAGSSCQLRMLFRPHREGAFHGILKVCGGHGNWCSRYPGNFEITVTDNTIVSNHCSEAQSRPFSGLTCAGSQLFSENFKAFMSQVLNAPESHAVFRYFQHKPSVDETTVACLFARQEGVGLDPNIQGGGEPLCELMGYATSNASRSPDTLSKQFPAYLTRLLGTSYPVSTSTVPLDELAALQSSFGTEGMDTSVQSVGYTGHVNFLIQYYQQQLGKNYTACGTSEICASIFYLPYHWTASSDALMIWPPLAMDYWGSSGGGGSGAGYQIQVFKSGSPTHYTLFTGGGGGGGGNTTPEGVGLNQAVSLINTGSGGGGGQQFADCYVNALGENLNGLGLGAGTGSGLSTPELQPVVYQNPPAVEYSFYAPALHPEWDDAAILSAYTGNLSYLFGTLIPNLYQQGYTIAVTGGGGGGTGLEFLNASGEEFTRHPLSSGHGFNFCHVFNKAGEYHTSDCVSATESNHVKLTLDQVIYQNLGKLFKAGMEEAILPEHCNGYTDYVCTCTYQHDYVIRNLTALLVASGFSANDVPAWLLPAHCSRTETASLLGANQVNKNSAPSTCTPPWHT